ncbi:MAG TPA: GIY-YIG nuclease family protein [Chitinophagaceae bacterium]|nr:GIY-YIG nuclease family protein [Chitinophagaceae bacterium]
MEYTVYILYSEKYQKIYIGFTSNLINRFRSHNEFGTKDWTRSFRPWVVVYCEHYTDKLQAMKRERQLKTASVRAIIRIKTDNEFKKKGYISNPDVG